MIRSKKELNYYLQCDKVALNITRKRPHLVGDYVWKFQIALRKSEYYSQFANGWRGGVKKLIYLLNYYRYKKLSIKLGFDIPLNVIGPGLAIVHPGTIVISTGAIIGKNCRIHEGVTIGANGGSSRAAFIGDNVFIGSGAKIIGEVKISSDVQIAANAVVVKDVISDRGCTVGGVPAKIISLNNSHNNLIKATELVGF